jgi:hypothetical protein
MARVSQGEQQPQPASAIKEKSMKQILQTVLVMLLVASSFAVAGNGQGLALGKVSIIEVTDLSGDSSSSTSPVENGILLRETLDQLSATAEYPDQRYAVKLGSAVFDLGNETLVVPDGVNLVGEGADRTRLTGRVANESRGLLHVDGRSELSDLSIYNSTIDLPDSVAIGISAGLGITTDPWSYAQSARLFSVGVSVDAQKRAIGAYTEAFDPWGTAGITADSKSRLSGVAFTNDSGVLGEGIGGLAVGSTAGLNVTNSSIVSGYNGAHGSPGYGVILEQGAYLTVTDNSTVEGIGSAIIAGEYSHVSADRFSRIMDQNGNTIVAAEGAQIRIKYSEIAAPTTLLISPEAEIVCVSTFELSTLEPLDRSCRPE